MRNKRFPSYPDDADYTTNAPSYYDDLARKEKLIRLLAERIWGYEEILDETLDEIQERFLSWDKNLEDFPEDVNNFLQIWLNDGTLDHIINDTLFNWKLDKTIFEQFRDALTTQLQQTEQSINSQFALTESKKADLTYVDMKIANMGNTKTFKGSVVFQNLPTGGNMVDDYYYVTDRDTNYCWNGSEWLDIGNNINIGDGTIEKRKLSSNAVSLYPFQENTSFILTKAGSTIDVSSLQKAVKEISLTGLSDTDDYYFKTIHSRYEPSLGGNRTYIRITRKHDGVDVCEYFDTDLHDENTFKEFKLTQLTNSGISGTIKINFSLIDSEARDNLANYNTSFDTLGISPSVRKYTEIKNELDTKKSFVANYPFQSNSDFKLVRDGVTYDIKSIQDALLDITFTGSDIEDNYYVHRFCSNYLSSVDGNRTYITIRRSSDNVTVCDYSAAEIHTGDEVKEFYLTSSNDSGITAIATVNFSKLDNDVNFQTNNYSPSYSSLGLSKQTYKSSDEASLNGLEIISPSRINCVVDHNTNINLDNVLLYGDYFNCERFVLSGKGTIEGEHEYIPTSTGNEKLTFRYYKGSRELKSKEITLNTISKLIGGNKKVMIIGDSTTNSGIPSSELLNLCSTDALNVELLGTRGTSPSLHEGRYGWTTDNYINSQSATAGSDGTVINPFYNPSTHTFDFSYYMTQQVYTGVDIVIINLGINDVSSSIAKETTLENYQKIINSIKAYNSTVKIIVALPTLPTRFTNQWGYSSGVGRKNQLLERIKLLLNTFENQEANNIFIAPCYMYVNPYWDMQYSEKELSNRNDKTFYYATDSTHPSEIGYKKVADCYFNVIKYIVSLE